MIDHIDQTVVEIDVRLTQLGVGILEQGIETHIHIHQLLRVDVPRQLHIRRIACGVVGGDHELATLAGHCKRSADTIDQQLLSRQLLVRQIVDGHHVAADEFVRREQLAHVLRAEQTVEHLRHPDIAVVQCRERRY